MNLKALEILFKLEKCMLNFSSKDVLEAIEELESMIKSYEQLKQENESLYTQSMSILNTVKKDN